MSKVERRRWKSSLDGGLPRKDRQGCEYEAYVPDPLEGREFRLDGTVAADVADAERAIATLDASAAALANTEALARLLLRAESVASSFIEGLVVGGRRLLRAEAARAAGETDIDVTADEVLGNIDAITWAVDALSTAEAVTVDGLLGVHERLLARTRLHEHAGQSRPLPKPPLPKPPLPTPSSRRFTPSSMATAVLGAHSSTSSSAGGASRRGSSRPSHSCSRRGPGPMSRGSRPPATEDESTRPQRMTVSTIGSGCLRPRAVERSTMQSPSRSEW